MICIYRHNAGFSREDIEADLDRFIEEPDTVSHLDLSHNQFGDSIALKVAQILSLSNTLRSIDLSYNKIGLDGHLAIARSLWTNRSLQTLHSHNNLNVSLDLVTQAYRYAAFVNTERYCRYSWNLFDEHGLFWPKGTIKATDFTLQEILIFHL